MRKGFTLIELLIVMIIVSTLVAIALPKYQTALERGRSLEGLRNVQYAAEYTNARHEACKIAGRTDEECQYSNFSLPQTDRIKSRFFGIPVSADNGTVTLSRLGGDWRYSFIATIDTDNGALYKIECSNTGEEDVCGRLDLTGNLMTRK